MTAYQQSEFLKAGRGLLIILSVLLLGILIYSIREFNERKRLRKRYPDDNVPYFNEKFGEILGKNFAAVVGYLGISLAGGLAFGIFGTFMIFVGFPLIFLALGLLSVLVPYPLP